MARFEEPRVAPPQHSDEQLRVLRCRHRVRVHRSHWPPAQKKGNEETAHVDVKCETCGAWVQAEDPPQKNLDVILYGDKASAQGRVLDEPTGQVLDESEIPPVPLTGTVSEEHELNPRGRRRA